MSRSTLGDNPVSKAKGCTAFELYQWMLLRPQEFEKVREAQLSRICAGTRGTGARHSPLSCSPCSFPRVLRQAVAALHNVPVTLLILYVPILHKHQLMEYLLQDSDFENKWMYPDPHVGAAWRHVMGPAQRTLKLSSEEQPDLDSDKQALVQALQCALEGIKSGKIVTELKEQPANKSSKKRIMVAVAQGEEEEEKEPQGGEGQGDGGPYTAAQAKKKQRVSNKARIAREELMVELAKQQDTRYAVLMRQFQDLQQKLSSKDIALAVMVRSNGAGSPSSPLQQPIAIAAGAASQPAMLSASADAGGSANVAAAASAQQLEQVPADAGSSALRSGAGAPACGSVFDAPFSSPHPLPMHAAAQSPVVLHDLAFFDKQGGLAIVGTCSFPMHMRACRSAAAAAAAATAAAAAAAVAPAAAAAPASASASASAAPAAAAAPASASAAPAGQLPPNSYSAVFKVSLRSLQLDAAPPQELAVLAKLRSAPSLHFPRVYGTAEVLLKVLVPAKQDQEEGVNADVDASYVKAVAKLSARRTMALAHNAFVMERIWGDSLFEFLPPAPAAPASLPIAERLKICVQLVRAIRELRKRGIHHRDISSTNVMVVSEESCRRLRAAGSGGDARLGLALDGFAPDYDPSSHLHSADPVVAGWRVVVIDFGMSTLDSAAPALGLLAGTPGYRCRDFFSEAACGAASAQHCDEFSTALTVLDMLRWYRLSPTLSALNDLQKKPIADDRNVSDFLLGVRGATWTDATALSSKQQKEVSSRLQVANTALDALLTAHPPLKAVLQAMTRAAPAAALAADSNLDALEKACLGAIPVPG